MITRFVYNGICRTFDRTKSAGVTAHRFGRVCFSGLILCGILWGCAGQDITALSRASETHGLEQQSSWLNDTLSSDQILPVLPSGFEGSFLAARQAVYDNDVERASHFFDKTTQSDSRSSFLLTQNFITHYQSGQLQRASEIARLLERQNIEFPLASEPAIAQAFKMRDWQAVIALSSKMEANQTSYELAVLLRGYAYFGAGQREQAYQELARFLQLSADSHSEIPAYHLLQSAHFSELDQQFDRARELYSRLADMDIKTGYLNLQIAAGLWRMQAYEKSQDVLFTKLPLSFNSAFIHNQFEAGDSPLTEPVVIETLVAQTMLEMSWFSEAARAEGFVLPRAQLALSLWPEFDAAHYVVGLSYSELGKFNAARQQLAQLSDKSAWAQQRLYILVDMAQTDERLDQARRLLTSYIDGYLQHTPQDTARSAELGTLYFLAGNIERYDGQYADAITYYQSSLSYQPDKAITWRNLAICFEQTQQVEDAEHAFSKALALNPNDAVALNYQGYWWADEGRRLDEAVDYIRRAVSLNPQSGYYADSLGWVYYKRGEYDKAVLWLEKAVQLAPNDAIIFDHLGDAYWHVGRFHEAQYKWQYALDSGGLTEQEAEQTRLKLQNGLLTSKTGP